MQVPSIQQVPGESQSPGRGSMAWRTPRGGSLERLRLENVPDTPPAHGEARVRVQAVGLNFADIFAVLGMYSATPQGAFVPGLEFSGIVDAVGPGTEAVHLGQPVIGLTRFGAYATSVTVDARYLRARPVGWTAAQGAAFPVQALTAWYAIRTLGAIEPGAAVLVHSAAGGVGLNALEILARLGARVVATIGSETKRPWLVDTYGLGPGQVIVRDSRRFRDQLDAGLRSIDARGFDLILDSVAGPFFEPGYRRLAPSGRIVIFGCADFMPRGSRPNWFRLGWQYLTRPRIDPGHMISANRSVMGFNLIWLWQRAELLPAAYDDLSRFIQRPPHVGREFAFADAPAAMRFLQSGQSVGKVVLVV
jgi:synaptic vesicle membrane protein VAT-1